MMARRVPSIKLQFRPKRLPFKAQLKLQFQLLMLLFLSRQTPNSRF